MYVFVCHLVVMIVMLCHVMLYYRSTREICLHM